MIEVRQTEVFSTWLRGLRDSRAKAKIAARIARLEHGNPGNIRAIGGGMSELRIDTGPGYRVYVLQRGKVLVILLCGGDKGSQVHDIKAAKELARQLKD